MNPSEMCPDTKVLQSWLECGALERAAADSIGSMADHLGRCEKCRSRLDRLSDSWGPEQSKWNRGDTNSGLASDEESTLRELKSRLLPLRPRNDDDAPVEEDAAAEVAQPILSAGTRIGGYEVERLIGRGATGSVYLVWDEKLQRSVALKVVSSHLLGEREYARWKHEAVALAAIDHPNVTRILGPPIETDGRTTALPIEYIKGGSVADLIVGRVEIPWRRTAALIAQAARGLAAIHNKGMVHRDIKPANILISGETAKVADLGLARLQSVASGLTRTGDVLGTPAYLSPEQCLGHPATSSTDIYSLGATFYEALTGVVPFQGTVAAVLKRIPDGVRTRPRQLDPSIPADMETICQVAMAPAVKDRYRTAEEMADDLERALRGEMISARTPSALGRGWRWCRRHPRTAALVMLLVGSILAGLAATTWQWRRAEQHRSEAEGLHQVSERRGRESERRRRLLAAKQAELRKTVDTLTAKLIHDPGFRDGISAPVRDAIWRSLTASYKQFLDEENDYRKDLMIVEKLNQLAEIGLELAIYHRARGAAEQGREALLPMIERQPPSADENVDRVAPQNALVLAEANGRAGGPGKIRGPTGRQTAVRIAGDGLRHADSWLKAKPNDFEPQRCRLQLRYLIARFQPPQQGTNQTGQPAILEEMRAFVGQWKVRSEPRLDLARALRAFSADVAPRQAIDMRREAARLLDVALVQRQQAAKSTTRLLREISVNQAILGKRLTEIRQTTAARESLSKAISIQKKLLDYQPHNHQWRNDHLETLVLIARTHADPAKARVLHMQAIDQVEALARMAPADTGIHRRSIELWLGAEQLEKRLQHEQEAHRALFRAQEHATIFLRLTQAAPKGIVWLIPHMRRYARQPPGPHDTGAPANWQDRADAWLRTAIRRYGETPELKKLRLDGQSK